VDIAHSGLVEVELDRLIERRSSREPDPDEKECGNREDRRGCHFLVLAPATLLRCMGLFRLYYTFHSSPTL
jgi:hypothetical protein